MKKSPIYTILLAIIILLIAAIIFITGKILINKFLSSGNENNPPIVTPNDNENGTNNNSQNGNNNDPNNENSSEGLNEEAEEELLKLFKENNSKEIVNKIILDFNKDNKYEMFILTIERILSASEPYATPENIYTLWYVSNGNVERVFRNSENYIYTFNNNIKLITYNNLNHILFSGYAVNGSCLSSIYTIENEQVKLLATISGEFDLSTYPFEIYNYAYMPDGSRANTFHHIYWNNGYYEYGGVALTQEAYYRIIENNSSLKQQYTSELAKILGVHNTTVEFDSAYVRGNDIINVNLKINDIPYYYAMEYNTQIGQFEMKLLRDPLKDIELYFMPGMELAYINSNIATYPNISE